VFPDHEGLPPPQQQRPPPPLSKAKAPSSSLHKIGAKGLGNPKCRLQLLSPPNLCSCSLYFCLQCVQAALRNPFATLSQAGGSTGKTSSMESR
jgi:hypothetical protein